MSRDVMHMFTIYARPADFPDVPFVVRGWLVAPGGKATASGELGFADTIEQARRMVPADMVCFERDESDEAQIVESWL